VTIAFSNLGTSANPDFNRNEDLSAYTNTSWTPPTSDLICVFVNSERSGAGTANQPTISGNSLTWTAIATATLGTNNGGSRVTLFGANASGSTAGTTTIDFASQTQTHCEASFFKATGVDLLGGVAAAFVQSPTNTGTATSGSVTLAASGNANNRPIAGFYHEANEAVTPRANWTELDDLADSGPGANLETQQRTDAFETTASATWTTSAKWIGVAAELKASNSLPLPSRSARNTLTRL
jgi:hypothetical protein